MQLARTPGWLLLPTVMETILADPDKRIASVKITVMIAKDNNKVIRSSVWFSGKHHRADGFTDISPDMLYAVCYH